MTMISRNAGVQEQERRETASGSGDTAASPSAHTVVGFAAEAVRLAQRKVFQGEEAARTGDNAVAGQGCCESAEPRYPRKTSTGDAQTLRATSSYTADRQIRTARFAERLRCQFEQRRLIAPLVNSVLL